MQGGDKRHMSTVSTIGKTGIGKPPLVPSSTVQHMKTVASGIMTAFHAMNLSD